LNGSQKVSDTGSEIYFTFCFNLLDFRIATCTSKSNFCKLGGLHPIDACHIASDVYCQDSLFNHEKHLNQVRWTLFSITKMSDFISLMANF
jgi:hypothetical protein